jgi:hypothetical protein
MSRKLSPATVVAGVALFFALGGGALAQQGVFAAGGAPAYALVDPNGGSPRLVPGHTSGFIGVSVGGEGQGDYCLKPAPGVNVTTTAAVASMEAFYSNAAGFVGVRYQPNGTNCGANQLEVKTWAPGPPPANITGLTNQVAFTVNVP